LHSFPEGEEEGFEMTPIYCDIFLWTGLSGYRRQQKRALYSTAVNMKLLMDMPEMVD